MPASQYLDTTRRRVLHVEGGVVDLQRLLEEMAADERRQAPRLGSRTPWYTRLPSVLPGGAGDVIRFGVHTWGSWADFDRTWAARIGPKIRDLASRVARYEELGAVDAHRRWPGPAQGEETELRQLLQHGNTAAATAERQAQAWMNSPAGAQDERATPWYQRWLRRTTRGTITEAAAGLVSGTRSGERFAAEFLSPGERKPLPGGAPRATAGGSGTVEETLVRAGLIAPSSPGQERLAPGRGDEGENGDGGTSWWSIAVTGALVVAGGYLVVTIAKDVMSRRAEPRAEAEEA